MMVFDEKQKLYFRGANMCNLPYAGLYGICADIAETGGACRDLWISETPET